MVLCEDTCNLCIPCQKLSVGIETVDKEVFSEPIEAEQLSIPCSCVLFVVVVAEQNVVPSFLFHQSRGKDVSNEASR